MVWDEEKILSYITGKIEESINLDYKAAGALAKDSKKTTEITKDVSAFANSGGGIIIYGVREFAAKELTHLPEKIDPIDRREFSKEWLEHITATIQPRPSVIIHSVQLSSAAEHIVYVVEIFPGTTAHQAKDCRYYKRYNFESVPMQDFEVRDVMHRRSNPIVKTEVRIIIGKHGFENRVFWRVTNESDVLARSVCSIIEIPFMLSGTPTAFDQIESLLDDDGYTCWRLVASNHGGGPFYPRGSIQAKFPFRFVQIKTTTGAPLQAREIVKFRTYADEMPPVSGSFDLKEITHQSQF